MRPSARHYGKQRSGGIAQSFLILAVDGDDFRFMPPTTLPLQKESPVPTEPKAGWWALQPLLTLWRRVTTPTTPAPEEQDAQEVTNDNIGMGKKGNGSGGQSVTVLTPWKLVGGSMPIHVDLWWTKL